LVAPADHDPKELGQLQSMLLPHFPINLAYGSTEADRLIETGSIDAVVFLRSVSAIDWKAQLRKIADSHPGLPVIVLSKTEQIGEFAEALDSGVFDFLVPPYGDGPLRAAVTQAVASADARAWQPTCA
jgi:DNA-binding NtrC family response regulator